MKKIVFILLSIMGYLPGWSQKISVQEYINSYKDIAISEMKRSGIPASITIAQGILETESGNSDLVKRSNNHFGIKCKNTWTGSSVFHDDDAAGECFRKYDNPWDSYKDHSNFLRGSSRYAFLFELDPSDYKAWAYGLKKAGYATNPRYPDILIRNIEENDLHQYDQDADGKPFFDAGKFKDKDDNDQAMVLKPIHYTEMNTAQNVESIKAGKTLFNGLKAVFVPKETSLLAIATDYNISLSKLMEYNDLKIDGLLDEEQWIFLEKKSKQGNRDIYLASKGETLHSIAQTNAIQLEYLLQYNDLKEFESLKKGTKVYLRPSKNAGNTNINLHKVQQKEGLYSISKKYNVPVQQIKDLNNLISDELTIGQELIISK
ncbi:MAG: glucosaminidase domain-containing protein [Ferruginibacter sp.]